MRVFTKPERSGSYFTNSQLYTVFNNGEIYTVEIMKGFKPRCKYNGKGEETPAIIGNGKLVKGNTKCKDFFIIITNAIKEKSLQK